MLQGLRLDPHDEERNASVGVQPALMKQSGEVRDPVTQAERPGAAVCNGSQYSGATVCVTTRGRPLVAKGSRNSTFVFWANMLLTDLYPKASCGTSALN